MGTKESKARYHNKAKDVDYNFAPALDSDIVDSQSNLAKAEKSLGTPWVIEEDAAYTPYFMKDGFKLVDDAAVQLNTEVSVSQQQKLAAYVNRINSPEELVQLTSDPICGSGWCENSDFYQKMLDSIVQYPAPEPLDSDIISTQDHRARALAGEWMTADE